MLARTLHTLWLLAVAALFLAAVVVMAGRLWVPVLGGYRAEVEALAGEALQRTVSIGRMQGTWRRLNPVLKLKDVVISDPDDPQGRLQIREVWIGLDVRNYLIEGQVRIASIGLIGAEATVIRDADGRIYIDHLEHESGASADPPGLPDVDRLSLHDSVIRYEDRQAQRPPVRLSDVTLTLDITDQRHTLTGYALLPPALGYRVDVSADLTGSLARPDQWNGRFYVEGQSLALSPDNLRALAADVDIAGVADVRGWVDMEDSRLRSVAGELEINGLLLHQSGAAAGTDYAVDRIAARFGWRRRAAGWQFAAQDIVVDQGESLRRGAGLWLAARQSGEATYYSGNLNRLYLQELQSVVRSIPAIPEPQRQRLVRLQPEGLVEQLYVDLRAVAGDVELLDFNASFRDLAIRPSDTLQISGLHGAVTGSAAAGAVWLHSRNAGFRDSALFRDELHFDELAGEAGWQYAGGTLVLASDEVKLVNPDFDLTSRVALELPAGGVAPQLDLQLDILRGDLGRIRHYLPARVMPATGVVWLDRSLVSGQINAGSVRLAGPLDKLPFDQGEGRLEVRLPVSNAVLDYNPEWTPIEALDAQVNFTGRRMDIESRQGRIRSASLVHVKARIDDLGKPDLQLTGTVQGDLPVMLAELGSSPLGKLYGGFVDRVAGTGAAGLDLEVFVPLHGAGREIDVKGTIRLEHNNLGLRQDGIGFEDIRGELAFDPGGISGKGLQARLLDSPIRVDVWSDPGAGTTNIGMQGPLDFVSLASQHQPGLAALLSGRANWSLRLGIGRLTSRDATPDVELELASTLQGISVNLPAPFGKPAAAVQPLAVRVEGIVNPAHVLHLRYGNNLQGIFSLRDMDGALELLRGNLTAGGDEAVMPDRRELSVVGRLDRFALDEWLPVAEVFERDPRGRGPPLRLDVAIGMLDLRQYVLEEVAIRMIESGQVRYIRLQGPMASGSLQLFDGPAGMERVSVELETLRLRKHDSATAAAELSVDPAALPQLDLEIARLNVEGIGLGKVVLRTVPRPDGLQVEHFTASSDMLDISATGNWRTAGSEPVSDFDIRLNDGTLETLLREFDYQEEVSGGKLSGALRASWPGAPWEFQPERIDGKLHLAIEKGRLLNIKPGAGRVLGLLSLHTVPRRLSLDFSDLFKKGFAFDHIEGSFVLNNGDAFTNDLYIEGPAARIDISGRIGLADKDYDELVTVVPHVSSSLPIAGAIAGGPIVGAALLVAEHLLGDELEKRTKFTHKQYTVTGPWSDPVYTPTSTGLSLEKIIGAPGPVEEPE